MIDLTNFVQLLGNLGQEPEVGQTKNGKEWCRFSLATNRNIPDATGGYVQQTSWHKVTCFGPVVNAAKRLTKGEKVLIQGRIEYGHYMNEQGVKIPTVQILADNLVFLSERTNNDKTSSGTTQGAVNSAPVGSEVQSDELLF